MKTKSPKIVAELSPFLFSTPPVPLFLWKPPLYKGKERKRTFPTVLSTANQDFAPPSMAANSVLKIMAER